jgi:mono/diheme cytochrome c family protein
VYASPQAPAKRFAVPAPRNRRLWEGSCLTDCQVAATAEFGEHRRESVRGAWTVVFASLCWATPAWAAEGPAAAPARGRQLYQQACIACHGVDGKGAPRALVGFDQRLPDFSDCNAYAREPDNDWMAVILRGGPARGFDRMMPAFGEALTPQQVDDVVVHVRSFCGDSSWPRGELNLPRAIFTEKAFPEDEAVLTSGIALDGAGNVTNELVFEKRFGPVTQIEIAVPFAYRNGSSASGWELGLGDVAFGVKRVLLQSLQSGSILSISGELGLPTGDARRGFGLGTATFAPYLTFGQLWPALGFVQAQAGVELPFHTAEKEAFARAAVGRTFNESGGLGRGWTPMLEMVATRALTASEGIHWDLVPECQVTLSRRQHVMASAGVRVPVDNPGAATALYVYLLWDFFDGGVLEGW